MSSGNLPPGPVDQTTATPSPQQSTSTSEDAEETNIPPGEQQEHPTSDSDDRRSLLRDPKGITVVVLSLFTGGGGLEIAMESLGFCQPHVLIIGFEVLQRARSMLSLRSSESRYSILSSVKDSSGQTGSVLALFEDRRDYR